MVRIEKEIIANNSEEGAVKNKKRGGKADWDHYTPDFVGTKTADLNLDSIVRQVSLAQKNFRELRVCQPEGRVKFQTELPVSIFFVGDVHFGSIYTDHDRFLREMAEIADTPNAYVFFMGNMIDNAINENDFSNAIEPEKQVVAIRKIIQELDEKGKVLGAVVSPCHEGWTYKKAGQDVNNLIYGYQGRKFPVLENGGRLHLDFPRAKYLLVVYHEIGNGSSQSETQALKQQNRTYLQTKADIVVAAHLHVAAVESIYEGTGKDRKPVVYLRSGTYKGIGRIHDQYASDNFGTVGEPSAQSVILWPNKKRMEPFLEFETGILALEAHYISEMVKKDEAEGKSD